MKYRIDPALSLPDEIRRIGNAEIDAAIKHLSGPSNHRHRAMHEARKRFKKLRGLLRLVRSVDRARCSAENARYRDVSRSLAAAREATALVETLDRFLKDCGKETAGGRLAAIRANLIRRRNRIVHGQVGMDASLASAIAACRQGKAAFDSLLLPETLPQAPKLLADGVEHTVRRARKALKHAKTRRAEVDFHDLRKAVKHHWMHLCLLQDVWPEATKSRRRQAEDLGERLGELNDIAVMRNLLKCDGEELGAPGEIGFFLALMKRKEKTLQRRCLKKANGLFAERPRQMAKEIRRAATIADRNRCKHPSTGLQRRNEEGLQCWRSKWPPNPNVTRFTQPRK
jgi:CHAD domain-containing protein